jgi:hypothetical protein
MLPCWTFPSSVLASFRASSTANPRMYAVTERPAERARCDNRSTSRAMFSAFVVGSCRQNSTSLAMTPTHATGTRPTQIHTKRANRSNAAARALKLPPHDGMLSLPRHLAKLPEPYRGRPTLTKPFQMDGLKQMLQSALDSGIVVIPFAGWAAPRGAVEKRDGHGRGMASASGRGLFIIITRDGVVPIK